jgi:N-methylhydantoinase A
MKYRIGIDVGGTFTDFLLVRHDDTFSTYKTFTSTPDQSAGIMEGLAKFVEDERTHLRSFLANIDLILHGTTATTNSVLTGSGARTGLLTTRGFRDALEMRRGVKERIYDNKYPAPPPLVPRYRRLPVTERIAYNGVVMEELDPASVHAACELLRRDGVTAIAICFLNAYGNGANETACKAIVSSELGDVYITASHELLPRIGFYDRLSTTVLNSYTGPILARYLSSLTKQLEENGFAGTLLVMQSSGGVVSAPTAIRMPAAAVCSGPAGGAIAGERYAVAHGHRKAVTFDMGGTSLDVARIVNGRAATVQVVDFDRYRVALPMVDVVSIGAGGGSLARMVGGLLRVGPESAGSNPGPACYGRGGRLPTVTDADLVLGYINPAGLLGGRVPLDVEAARNALKRHIADSLGVSPEAAAAAVYDVINVNMASAVKDLLYERGDDPREFALVAAGGAGPLHAAHAAAELAISTVIIPRDASIFTAAGVILSDLRHDFVQTHFAILDEVDVDRLGKTFASLETRGREALTAESIPAADQKFERSLDLRYERQIYEIQVPLGDDTIARGDLAAVADRFHRMHNESYGYELPDARIELVNVRVVAIGRTRPFWFPEQPQAIPPIAVGTRSVFLPGSDGVREIPIFDSEDVGRGARLNGPALVEGLTTSVLIPAGWELHVDPYGTYVLHAHSAVQGGRSFR